MAYDPAHRIDVLQEVAFFSLFDFPHGVLLVLALYLGELHFGHAQVALQFLYFVHQIQHLLGNLVDVGQVEGFLDQNSLHFFDLLFQFEEVGLESVLQFSRDVGVIQVYLFILDVGVFEGSWGHLGLGQSLRGLTLLLVLRFNCYYFSTRLGDELFSYHLLAVILGLASEGIHGLRGLILRGKVLEAVLRALKSVSLGLKANPRVSLIRVSDWRLLSLVSKDYIGLRGGLVLLELRIVLRSLVYGSLGRRLGSLGLAHLLDLHSHLLLRLRLRLRHSSIVLLAVLA